MSRIRPAMAKQVSIEHAVEQLAFAFVPKSVSCLDRGTRPALSAEQIGCGIFASPACT